MINIEKTADCETENKPCRFQTRQAPHKKVNLKKEKSRVPVYRKKSGKQ